MADALLRFIAHPLAVVPHVLGQTLCALPCRTASLCLRSLPPGSRRSPRKLWRNFDHRLVDEHGDRIQIAGIGFKTKALCLQRQCPAARERIVQAGSLSGLNRSAACGWSLFSSQVSRHDLRISARAFSRTSSFVVFSHLTRSSRMLKSRLRLAAQLAFRLFGGISPGMFELPFPRGVVDHLAEDHGARCSKGRRAHQRCSVLGCP